MELKYADIFWPRILDLYGHELKSVDLFNSNKGINIINGKTIRLPKLSVGGYKDHNRQSITFNTGAYSNDYEDKTLDHDRDIEFAIDPMDVDETNKIVSIANVHSRFEKTQAIPELDCYVYSKLYTEAKRVKANIKTGALTTANVLSDFDKNLSDMEDAGVPLSRVILYCTTDYKTLLKNAEGVQRYLDISKGNGIDRRVHSIDDVGKIITVPKERFKTVYNFTDGYAADPTGKQIDYILIDPESQVSRVKYSYINTFTPGHDSRCSDKYLYQNRRYNGTFALDELLAKGCIIHAEADKVVTPTEPTGQQENQ